MNLTDAAIARVQSQVRRRVPAWLARRGVLADEAAAEMLAWRHSGGFSLDASVRLAAWDRQGLERLARFCARPSFAEARLDRLSDDTLAYRLKKPLADGRTCLYLTPLELLAHLAALIPPPRVKRAQRYVWALQLARIYDVLSLVGKRCGHAMKILAFVTEAATVRRILAHVGEAVAPPEVLPSRAPPREEFAWDRGSREDFDPRTEFSEAPW